MRRLPSILAVVAIRSLSLRPASAQRAEAASARAEFIKNARRAVSTAIDTNHDGKLITRRNRSASSSSELQRPRRDDQQAAGRVQPARHQPDGQLSLAGVPGRAPRCTPTETPQRLLQQLDTNHDGKISADEFARRSSPQFDQVDTNHDGIVTPAEAAGRGGRQIAASASAPRARA